MCGEAALLQALEVVDVGNDTPEVSALRASIRDALGEEDADATVAHYLLPTPTDENGEPLEIADTGGNTTTFDNIGGAEEWQAIQTLAQVGETAHARPINVESSLKVDVQINSAWSNALAVVEGTKPEVIAPAAESHADATLDLEVLASKVASTIEAIDILFLQQTKIAETFSQPLFTQVRNLLEKIDKAFDWQMEIEHMLMIRSLLDLGELPTDIDALPPREKSENLLSKKRICEEVVPALAKKIGISTEMLFIRILESESGVNFPKWVLERIKAYRSRQNNAQTSTPSSKTTKHKK